MAQKILVVDDDKDFVESVTSLLVANGFEVISAHASDEGFRKARLETPDLILLDVMMSRRTEGFDMADNLKKNNLTKDIPIILITGICKELDLPFTFEPDTEWLPVKAVLEKPITPEVLLAAVQQGLKKKS